jgi:hypothetical protein
MKTWIIIRFVLAAAFATLASAGLLAHLIGSGMLFWVSWLFVMGRERLTRPIPRNERWLTLLVIGIFLAVMLTLPFLHLSAAQSAVKHGMSHPVIVAALWMIWMWVIYHGWQRERLKNSVLLPAEAK